jgi:hypothetical protein
MYLHLISHLETAAYRQLLGDTVSSQQKTMSYEDSDDNNDDIENQLGLTSPRNQPMRSVAAPYLLVSETVLFKI